MGLEGCRLIAVITEELAAIWKRMCSTRGVLEEFEDLKTAVENLAGSAGVAEYYRILRQHGVDRPRQFKIMQRPIMRQRRVRAARTVARECTGESGRVLTRARDSTGCYRTEVVGD